MHWSHLYSQNCPPPKARNIAIDPIYRFVSSTTITIKDFEPHKIRYPNKKYTSNQCIALGTSIYSDYQEMLKLQKVFPRFKTMKIVKGKIEAQDGETLMGKDSHITWWIRKINLHTNFTIIP